LQRPPAHPPIFTHLDGRTPIRRHEHVAILYKGRAAAFRQAAFLGEGLASGDQCCYLAPGAFHAEMLARLRSIGVDLDRHLRAQTLVLQRGMSDSQQLLEWTEQLFLDAERTQKPAVRWLEEGVWPEPLGFPMPQFFEFHALLNYQVKQYPSVALCQYDMGQIELRHLFCAIAVHRHLLVEDTLVRDNPFYIPAEKFIPLSPEEREHDLLQIFREVGFDLSKMLAALIGYGQIQRAPSEGP
jgi:hypothetical protein